MWCACVSGFLGLYGLFGWVHFGMVHRCVTAKSCHGARAVCAARAVQQLPHAPC